MAMIKFNMKPSGPKQEAVSTPMKNTLVKLMEVQLIPTCMIFSPFLFIFISNMYEIAFGSYVFIGLAVIYLLTTIALFALASYRYAATIRVSFIICVTFIVFNGIKLKGYNLNLAQDWLIHIVALGCIIYGVKKISIDKIKFISYYSTIVFIMNGFLIGSPYFSHYQDEVLRAGLSNHQSTIENEAQPTEKKQGNVYHILLDGFQSSVYNDIAKNHNYSPPKDFVYFPKFKSSYSATSYSMPNILLGEYYDSAKDIYKWQFNDIRERGLFKSLTDGGINVNLYPHSSYFCAKNVTLCKTNSPYNDPHVIEQSQLLVFDLWFQFFLPSALDRVLCPDCNRNQDAQARTDFGFSITNFLGLRDPNFVPIQYAAYFASKSLQTFYKDEKGRSANGNYVYIHLMIPHPPYITDENCSIDLNNMNREDHPDRKKNIYGLYKDQSRCALKLLGEITDKIKAEGHYEDSMIIVHSDHGFKFITPEKGPVFSWTQLNLEQRNEMMANKDNSTYQLLLKSFSDVILLIKPPQGESLAQDLPLQPIDITPIILDHYNVPNDIYPGMDLTSLHSPAAKTRAPQIFNFNFFKMPEKRPDIFERYEATPQNTWKRIENAPQQWEGTVYND
jgi:hypothetical protein